MSGPVFTVEPNGGCWAVCRDGEMLFALSTQALAEMKREKLERAARRKRRPCITCGGVFLSDGPHHRMCKGCRAWASDVYQGAV